MPKEPSYNEQVDDKGELPPQEERENLSPDDMRASGGTAPADRLEPNEMTAWDGQGNPIKHVFTDDEGGRLAQGTGHTTEEAEKEAKTGETALGPDASPGKH
ncbi:MAG: hypothetical protein KY452_04475 [Actinobacteria bacterium]|nr:hypothetical protein [Actinomycetota bacterium]